MIPKGSPSDLSRRKTCITNGGFSVYFPLRNGVGIKMIVAVECSTPVKKAFKTQWGLKRSKLWQAAQEEFEILKHVEPSGVTPKPFGLQPVYADTLDSGKGWYPGIYMQHISGPTLGNATYSMKNMPDEMDVVAKLLAKVDKYIRCGDTHNGNVIVELHKTGKIRKYWLIDMSPEFNHIKE